MITITNSTPPNELSSQWHTYQIRVNWNVLANFQHRPSDGIVVCFRQAVRALVMAGHLEAQSRFPNETKQDPEKVPDEADGHQAQGKWINQPFATCEEILHAEAQATEASLEEKDLLAGGIPKPEALPGADALVLAMLLGDHDRAQRELASSLREKNASNLVVRDPGL